MNFQPPEQDDPRDDDDREQARDWSKIESFVDEYIDGYEMIGESEDGRDACYTPNANDRALLRDCMAGLLAEQAFIEMLSTSQIQPPQDERGQGLLNQILQIADLYRNSDMTEGNFTCRVIDAIQAAPLQPAQPVALSALTDEQVLEYCDAHPKATFAEAVFALAASAPAQQATPPQPVAAEVEKQALIDWVIERWHAEVANRPMVNVHRRALDDTWRQVLRHLSVDDRERLGPTHDELREQIGGKEWSSMMAGTGSDESKENSNG